MASESPSWLMLVHVSPPPEGHEVKMLENLLEAALDIAMPGYLIEVASMWAADIDVISLDDLDSLPTTTST